MYVQERLAVAFRPEESDDLWLLQPEGKSEGSEALVVLDGGRSPVNEEFEDDLGRAFLNGIVETGVASVVLEIYIRVLAN